MNAIIIQNSMKNIILISGEQDEFFKLGDLNICSTFDKSNLNPQILKKSAMNSIIDTYGVVNYNNCLR